MAEKSERGSTVSHYVDALNPKQRMIQREHAWAEFGRFNKELLSDTLDGTRIERLESAYRAADYLKRYLDLLPTGMVRRDDHWRRDLAETGFGYIYDAINEAVLPVLNMHAARSSAYDVKRLVPRLRLQSPEGALHTRHRGQFQISSSEHIVEGGEKISRALENILDALEGARSRREAEREDTIFRLVATLKAIADALVDLFRTEEDPRQDTT